MRAPEVTAFLLERAIRVNAEPTLFVLRHSICRFFLLTSYASQSCSLPQPPWADSRSCCTTIQDGREGIWFCRIRNYCTTAQESRGYRCRVRVASAAMSLPIRPARTRDLELRLKTRNTDLPRAKRLAEFAENLTLFLNQFPSPTTARTVGPSAVDVRHACALPDKAADSDVFAFLSDPIRCFARLCEHVSALEKAKGPQETFKSLIPSFWEFYSRTRNPEDKGVEEAVARRYSIGLPLPEPLVWLLVESLPADSTSRLLHLVGRFCQPEARDRLAVRLAVLSQRGARYMVEAIRVLRTPAAGSRYESQDISSNFPIDSSPTPHREKASAGPESVMRNLGVSPPNSNEQTVFNQLMEELKRPVPPIASSCVPPSQIALTEISWFLRRFYTASALSCFVDMCLRFGWKINASVWQKLIAAHCCEGTQLGGEFKHLLDAASRDMRLYNQLVRYFAAKRMLTKLDLVLEFIHRFGVRLNDVTIRCFIVAECQGRSVAERVKIGEWTLRLFGVARGEGVAEEWLENCPLLRRLEKLILSGGAVPGISTLVFALNALSRQKRWNIIHRKDLQSTNRMRSHVQDVYHRAVAVLRAVCDIPETITLKGEPVEIDITYSGPRLVPTTSMWGALLPMVYANHPLEVGDRLILQMECPLVAISPPDVKVYNAQLAAYLRHGKVEDVLQIFTSKMRFDPAYPECPPVNADPDTLLLMVTGLARAGDFQKATSVREQIWEDLQLRRGHKIAVAPEIAKISEDPSGGGWTPPQTSDRRWVHVYQMSELALLRCALESCDEEAVFDCIRKITSWSSTPSPPTGTAAASPPSNLLTKAYNTVIAYLVRTNQVASAMAILDGTMKAAGVARSLFTYTPFLLKYAERRDVPGVRQWLDRIRADGLDVDIPLRIVLDSKFGGSWWDPLHPSARAAFESPRELKDDFWNLNISELLPGST